LPEHAGWLSDTLIQSKLHGAGSHGIIRLPFYFGITGCNSATVMAPWGGGKSAIGNNPLAIAVPTKKPYPLILDMAMNVVSGKRPTWRRSRGRRSPSAWILDEQSRPADNPADMFPNGTLLPMGYKVFGMAIMIEILFGVLILAATLGEIPLWFDKITTPTNLGHFFMAIDTGTFLASDSFRGLVDHL
jgi:LDH2 family malate/lactate/ureidoglycolate dehydrogenase